MCNLVESKRINSTVVEEVATAVKDDRAGGGIKLYSARGIVQTLDKPVNTIHKILSNILHSLSLQN